MAVCCFVVAEVTTLNVALRRPAGIVTVEGTLAIVEELVVRETVTPPLTAGPFKLTVAMQALPPATVEGLRFSPESATGRSVRFAD